MNKPKEFWINEYIGSILTLLPEGAAKEFLEVRREAIIKQKQIVHEVLVGKFLGGDAYISVRFNGEQE